jgi:prophage antirepressor-like protein
MITLMIGGIAEMQHLAIPERLFQYHGQQVRVLIRDGQPWFVAKDACEALNISNHRDAVARLNPSMRDDVGIPDAMGRTQVTTVISEAGVYKLTFRSYKPEAEAFSDWVAGEVLPSIRRDGLYVTDALLNDPDHLLRVTQRLVEERKVRLEAERQLQLQAPKVELYDILLSAKNAQTMNEVAKAFGWGRNRLFAFLRKKGILMKNNLPYQDYLESGYFEVREVITQRGEFTVNVTQTLVTPKGIDFIGRLLRNAGNEAGVMNPCRASTTAN